jgi:O-antigen ligase
MLFWWCGIVLALAVILGGATHAGYLGDAVIQLTSVPLLASALWPALSARHQNRQKARLTLYLCFAVALIVLAQLLPLPFDYWSGGASLLSWPLASEFEWKGQAWGTISLTPQATWAAAASMIVPLAIFGAVAQLGCRQRARLVWLLLALGVVSLVLGLVQVAQGPASGLRFYDVTNEREAVGLFANRNHFAAYLYVSLVLAGIWLIAMADSHLQRENGNSKSMLGFAAAAAILVAMLAGIAFAKSRAGLLLAMFALGGIVAIMLRQRRPKAPRARPGRFSTKRASFAAIAFGILFAAQFGLGGMIARLGNDPAADLRVTLNQTAWRTAIKALPFGTGLGSFVPVYAAAEQQQDIFAGYANRAHNDFVEFLLETGVIGAVMITAFLAWFVRRSYQVWKTPQTNRDPLHLVFERAATIVIALLLLHSLADYPLRTAALSAIFALFFAILAVPASDADAEIPQLRSREARHVAPAAAPRERWGSEVNWPGSWQKAPGQGRLSDIDPTKFYNKKLKEVDVMI